MINQLNYIFSECENCGKTLNEMEKNYCNQKLKETGIIIELCSLCLDKQGGEWPTMKMPNNK